MPSRTDHLDVEPDSLLIHREVHSSDASSIFEVTLRKQRVAMKLYHNNGDPGIAENGRDLNRFRCELDAYRKLSAAGVCETGFVPQYHGFLDEFSRSKFDDRLISNFSHDKFDPHAIFLEYLEDATPLNCVNVSPELIQQAAAGLKAVHGAFVHHRDIYPKNILIVGTDRKRAVWIDFDVSTTVQEGSLSGKDIKYSQYEETLFASLGELLLEDQREGLPPNTKFY